MANKVRVDIDGKETVSPAAKQAAAGLSTLKDSTAHLKTEAQNLMSPLTNLRSAFSAIAGPIGAAVVGLKAASAAANAALQSFYQQEEAMARVQAVLQATGKSATISARAIEELGARFQKTTIFGDDLVANAAALALTFDAVSEETLPRVMSVAADLATTFGTDLVTAARDLGMALEDPEAGMNKLRRSGVIFDEQTKALVKSLTEQGKTIEASNVLLEELERRVGGAATIMGDTASGAATRLANAFDDIKEALGGMLAEFAKPGMDKLTQLLEAGSEGIGRMRLAKQAETLTYGQASGMSSDTLSALHGAATDALANAIMWKTLTAGERSVQTAAFGTRASDAVYWDNIVDRLTDMIETALIREEQAAKAREGAKTAAAAAPPFLKGYGIPWLTQEDTLREGVALFVDVIAAATESLATMPDAIDPMVHELEDYLGEMQNAAIAAASGRTGFQQASGPGAAGMTFTEYGSEGEMGGVNRSSVGGYGAQLAAAFADMLQSIASIKLLMDPIATIMQGALQVLGPLLDTALAPLVGILITVGQLLGTMLAPVIEMLTPVVELVGKAFVWLYNNIIVPVGNVIYSIFQGLGNMLKLLVNAFISVIKFFGGGANLEYFDQAEIERAALAPIDFQTLVATGGTAISNSGGGGYGGTAGSRTTVEYQPDINIYQTFQAPVIGEGGAKEIGKSIAGWLEDYAGFGGKIHIEAALT